MATLGHREPLVKHNDSQDTLQTVQQRIEYAIRKQSIVLVSTRMLLQLSSHLATAFDPYSPS